MQNIKVIMILSLLFIIMKVGGQELFQDNPDVFNGSSGMQFLTIAGGYVPNGGSFTPKGDMRVLIIFASFGGSYDNQYVGGWPNSSAFPDWANSSSKPFYTTEAEFINSASDQNIMSVSKFYYDMSNPNDRLRIFADYYPSRVIVDASTSFSWGEVNRKVIAQIPSSFDWSPYDNRINNPNFVSDYSGFASDTKPDFVIICYRFSNDPTYTPPVSNMKSWCKCNGFSSNDLSGATSNGYTFTNAGFTHVTGASSIPWMFIHETGHSLYDAPHYNGNNGVAGEYFYIPLSGWGMMSLNTFTCALGWERWVLGWIDQIEANGVNSDINTLTDLPSNGVFTLRDFLSTGDLIRIKIPNGSNKNQYLWIENHQGISIFDNNYNGASFCGATVPSAPRGIVAYVESINDSRYNTSMFYNGNSIRFLHADGNYDFSFDPTPLNPELAYCGNVTYNLFKNDANSIAGQNIGEYIRKDFDNNGITYNTYTSWSLDNSAKNEGTPVVVLDGITSADNFLGKDLAFNIGQKAGLSENPCITNIPTFSDLTGMAPFYLNGISFEVLSQVGNGVITIQVKLDDVEVDKNIRMAGTSIVLQNITNNSNPDIYLLEGKIITINRSGTENTTTKIDGEFINYTHFKCEYGSYIKMEPNSKIIVDERSTFTLQSGSTLEIEDGAEFIVTNNSRLEVESGAAIIIKGSGRLSVKCDGQLCVNPGATLNLQDFTSCIFYDQGALASGCLSDLSSVITGPGFAGINGYGITIDNTSISTDKYYAGYNISSSNTTIQGTGTEVVFDAINEVLINSSFEVGLGATFETRTTSGGCGAE